jgi:hypothetical protein
MGNSPSQRSSEEGSEHQQLSREDGSPFFPLAREPCRPHLLHHIPVLTLVDIIMEYSIQQQHLIIILDNDIISHRHSPWSIGWVSSELPPRSELNVEWRGIHAAHMERYADTLTDDSPGYRRIFGAFPMAWTRIRNVAIINDRLYLLGGYHEGIQVIIKLISCSIDDILASSLSSTMPMTTSLGVSSLITWKMDHAPLPSYAFSKSYDHGSLSSMSTCVWRHRLVIVTNFRSIDNAITQHDPDITHQGSKRHGSSPCCYYDTITDTYHRLPTLPVPLTSKKEGQYIRVQCIHDRLYVCYSKELRLKGNAVETLNGHIMVYNETTNEWVPLIPNTNVHHLLPTSWMPLPSSKSAVAATQHGVDSKNNEQKNNYMTIIHPTLRPYSHGRLYEYERYDIRNGQLKALTLTCPSWCQPPKIPLVVGNNEWLIWTEHKLYQMSAPMGIVQVNNIHNEKKWRSWPRLPHGSRFVVVSGENGSDDNVYITPYNH